MAHLMQYESSSGINNVQDQHFQDQAEEGDQNDGYENKQTHDELAEWTARGQRSQAAQTHDRQLAQARAYLQHEKSG